MSSHRTSTNTSTAQDLSFCILWSPLPPITWLIPFIGHMGIADSNGIASDFQGSYYVGDRGRMAFGPPTRALQIHISEINGGAEHWDRMIMEANQIYNTRVHNLCCDNCHSHVATALGINEVVSEIWEFTLVDPGSESNVVEVDQETVQALVQLVGQDTYNLLLETGYNFENIEIDGQVYTGVIGIQKILELIEKFQNGDLVIEGN